MTPEQLKKWRTDLKLSQRAASQALGLTLNGYQQMERGAHFTTGAPMAPSRAIALACAAIRHGLAPEGG